MMSRKVLLVVGLVVIISIGACLSAAGIRVASNSDNPSERHLGNIKSGNWISYLVDVAEAGSYLIRFRFDADEQADVDIVVKDQSGDTVGVYTVHTAHLNKDQGWYLDGVVVNLQAGKQELVIEFAGENADAISIDWMEFEFAQ